jgi:hypothetical protein
VLAFVLALIGIVVGLLTLLWWVAVIPFLLGVSVLMRVSPRERRGRVLAALALVLALFSGSCTFILNSASRTMYAKATDSILGALGSESSEASQEGALARWMYRPALERAGLLEQLRARHAAVTARFGPFTPPASAGSLFGGNAALSYPPEGLVEVPEDPDAKPPPVGHTIWTRARFGDQVVHVALELIDGGGMGDAVDAARQTRRDGSTPIVSDVRYFAAPPAADAAPR